MSAGKLIGFCVAAITAAALLWAMSGSAAISPPIPAQTLERAGCKSPSRIVPISFSRDKYPNIIRHIKKSWRKGYPKVLQINRPGADRRRDRLFAETGIPTKDGYDRDEAPAAVLRKSWKASVMYVPLSENRSAGASLGYQISPYCDGVSVRYKFTR